jgi:hypothetical protein
VGAQHLITIAGRDQMSMMFISRHTEELSQQVLPMKHVVDVDEVVRENAVPLDIGGRYVLLRVPRGVTGVNWEKALEALNIMAESGWSVIEWIAVQDSRSGFLMEQREL